MSQGFLWMDIAGLTLTLEDRELLAHPAVSGVILFSRNFESIAQLKALTISIKKLFPEMIITVDQEGGRVQRFREGFTELPSMQSWGDQFKKDENAAKKAFSAMLTTMIQELQSVGIDSSLVPVLDIHYGKSAVIGHRSFGESAAIVTKIADFMIDQCHALNMPVCGKHFPGHGFVTADSHHELPIDDRSLETIFSADLKPFALLAKKLDSIMLAHVVYAQIDSNPVCFSPFWIQTVLRKELAYDGLIITDDLSMNAITPFGSYAERGARALEAGVDILLVCNNRDGVIDILDHIPFEKSVLREKRLVRYRQI